MKTNVRKDRRKITYITANGKQRRGEPSGRPRYLLAQDLYHEIIGRVMTPSSGEGGQVRGAAVALL